MKKYNVGEKYSDEMEFEFLVISAKGIIVYNNGANPFHESDMETLK